MNLIGAVIHLFFLTVGVIATARYLSDVATRWGERVKEKRRTRL